MLHEDFVATIDNELSVEDKNSYIAFDIVEVGQRMRFG